MLAICVLACARRVCRRAQDDELVKSHLINIFQLVDINGSGHASVCDVEAVLGEFGLEADGMAEAHAMLRAAAAAEGGDSAKLSYDTFVEVGPISPLPPVNVYANHMVESHVPTGAAP